MSYQGPMLIKEPELRWPIVLLAALMTGVLALLLVVTHYVASTSSSTDTSSSKRVEWMIQPVAQSVVLRAPCSVELVRPRILAREPLS